MKIETRYELGTHVLAVYADGHEVYLYDDYISDVVLYKDTFEYGLEESCNYLKEDEIILFEDKDRLYEVICEKLSNIRREGEHG